MPARHSASYYVSMPHVQESQHLIPGFSNKGVLPLVHARADPARGIQQGLSAQKDIVHVLAGLVMQIQRFGPCNGLSFSLVYMSTSRTYPARLIPKAINVSSCGF